MTTDIGTFRTFLWEDGGCCEGRSDYFLAMNTLTTTTFFLLSRTSQGEEPLALDTGGGRVSLPRCLFWSSGHCQRFGAGNVSSRSGLSPFVVFELYDMRDKQNNKKSNSKRKHKHYV